MKTQLKNLSNSANIWYDDTAPSGGADVTEGEHFRSYLKEDDSPLIKRTSDF